MRVQVMAKPTFREDKLSLPKLIRHCWVTKSLLSRLRSPVKSCGIIGMWQKNKHFATKLLHSFVVSSSFWACSSCSHTWRRWRSTTCTATPQQRTVILLTRSSCSQMARSMWVCMSSMLRLTSRWPSQDRVQVFTSAIANRMLIWPKLQLIKTTFATHGSVRLMEDTRSVRQWLLSSLWSIS